MENVTESWKRLTEKDQKMSIGEADFFVPDSETKCFEYSSQY